MCKLANPTYHQSFGALLSRIQHRNQVSSIEALILTHEWLDIHLATEKSTLCNGRHPRFEHNNWLYPKRRILIHISHRKVLISGKRVWFPLRCHLEYHWCPLKKVVHIHAWFFTQFNFEWKFREILTFSQKKSSKQRFYF